MKVYIVTSGKYSDYHICQVFSTRLMAQQYIDILGFNNDDKMWVEEYEVNKVSIEPPKSMNVSGYFEEDELVGVDFDDGKEEPWSFAADDDTVDFTGNIAVHPGETAEQFRERAEKVVVDKYFEWKVNNYG